MNSIAENAVGGLIASQVDGVIGMIISRLEQEIKLAWGFSAELEKLKQEFTRLHILVSNGVSSRNNGKYSNNQLIEYWGNIVKEMCEEANDLLDEWSYELLRRKALRSLNGDSGGRKRDKLIKYPISRWKMGHKLRTLINNISGKVYAEADRLGIRLVELCNQDHGGGSGSSSQQIMDHESSLYYQRQSVDFESMIGRDGEMNQLVELLCESPNCSAKSAGLSVTSEEEKPTLLTVVGIVGMAGLGKTALCMKIVNEARVKAQFNSVVWVVASGKPGVANILKQMAAKVCPEETKMEDREDVLNNELKKKLNGKRCLLILDDVWDSSWWKKSWGPLERTLLLEIGLGKGSKVLVTSRQREVIQVMKTHCYDVDDNLLIKKPKIHQLEVLSDVKSRELLRKRLIRNVENLDNDAEKTRLAENMLKKCGGVPLAIIALAGLLIRDQSIHMWRKFDQDDLWMEKEDEFGILPSLKLSFNYLPSSSLKACFAFCGIFEEDEVIIKDKLICMWMAHGWLESDDNDGDDIITELKGEEYCKVLLNSSLLQEAQVDKYGNVRTFKMHDLVWSLARVVSKGECLCLDGEYDGSSQVRHLSLPHSKQELTFASNMKLQTCLYKNSQKSNLNFLLRCRHLRVLSIGEIEGDDDYYSKWEMIGRLKHLRYLEFKINRLKEVEYSKLRPRLIKPYNLQTLWINYSIDSRISNSCSPLFKNGIGDLVNLRHIHYECPDGFGIPEGLGKLTALQTLPEIDFNSNWGGKVSELGLLNNLRGALRLKNLKWIKGRKDASSICLGDKKKLETIQLHFDGLPWSASGEEQPHQQNEVLEALQPPSNLKNLEITDYQGTKLPRWLTEEGYPLDNLISLMFVSCEHAEGDLKIENFQYLRVLKMIDFGKMSISFPDHGFQCCQGLEKLILLTSINERPRIPLHSFLGDLSPLTKLRVLWIEWGETGSSELVGLGSLPCLTELRTNQLLPADLDQHSPLCNSLQFLSLYAPSEGEDDDDTITTFPVQLQHLVALQRLEMRYYKDETIPEWLGSLTSLSILEFCNMKELKHLPSKDTMKRLSNFHTLQVWDCPFLKEDLENHSGEEWLKVNHIPHVQYKDY